MAKKRGPAPSGKTETILARVSPDTRRMLEKACVRSGLSLSREIERRLARPFDEGIDIPATPETEALLLALKAAIARIEQQTGERWHKDAFTWAAVLEVPAKYLIEMKPEGDSKPPTTFPTDQPPQLRRAFAKTYARGGFGTVVAAQVLELMDRESEAADTPQFYAAFPAEREAGRILWGLIRSKPPQVALRMSEAAGRISAKDLAALSNRVVPEPADQAQIEAVRAHTRALKAARKVKPE